MEIVRFVDIGGIVDHYCLNFLFIEKPRIEVESSYNLRLRIGARTFKNIG